MKHIVYSLTFLFGLGLTAAYSQTQHTTNNPGFTGTETMDVQWQAIGPHAIPLSSRPPAAGKTQAFAVDFANPNLMYAGGGAGPGNSGPYSESGVFKSVDGGNSWVAVNAGLTDPMVDVLWLDQANPNIVLAGTWFDGIFRTTDGGSNWTLQASLGSTTSILQIGNTLYAATAHGIAESADSGVTWTVTKTINVPVRVLTASGTALYAGLDNGEVLYRASPDSSWRKIMFEPGHTVWSIATDPTSMQTLYVVQWYNYYPDVSVSHDAGGTWAPLYPEDSSNAQFHNAAQVITVDDSGTIYVGFDGSLYLSNDHGVNWTSVPETNWDIRFIMAWPGQAGRIVLGTDQGLYTTTDKGNSFTGLNGHMKSSLLTGVAVHDSTIFTAVQDFSPIYTFNGGKDWEIASTGLPAGEDGIVRINPGDADYCYVYTIAGLQLSTDGGRTFKSVPNIQFTFAGGRNLIGADLLYPNQVYVAAQGGVYGSVDWGMTWSKLSWPFTDPSLVVVNPLDDNTIFVGTQSNGLYVTHDAGSTWKQCNLSSAAGHPYTLDIDPSDTGIVEVGMTAAPGAGGGVLLSNDGGATFKSYNAGLPSSAASLTSNFACTLGFNPNSSDGESALATSNGIYLSKSPGSAWIDISGNIVPKDFRDLEWAGGSLYAATYGEGVVVTNSSITAIRNGVGETPTGVRPLQNFPNPFNPSTSVRFDLNHASRVTLSVFNILGQKVLEENYGVMSAGTYDINIDMKDFASGMYFYTIVAGTLSRTGRMILLK